MSRGPLVVLTDSQYERGKDDWKTVPGFESTYFQSLSMAVGGGYYFPPGHPQPGTVYFPNPVLDRAFYPAADFHRLTFEHKFSEAMRLVVALGAKQVLVEHVTGWAKEFAASLTVPVAQGDIAGDASQNTSLLFYAALPGSHEPSIPTDLAWFPHEPSWRAVAEARVESVKDRENSAGVITRIPHL